MLLPLYIEHCKMMNISQISFLLATQVVAPFCNLNAYGETNLKIILHKIRLVHKKCLFITNSKAKLIYSVILRNGQIIMYRNV